MKIKKPIKFNKILNLKLFKNKIYDLKLNSRLNIKLKTYMKVIFKYFLFNKKIALFNCLNKLNSLIFKTIKSINCVYVPQNLWLNGLLSNFKIIFKFLVFSKSFNKLVKFMFNLQSDLILIFKNHINRNELLNFNVPILSFNEHNQNLYDYSFNLFYQKKFEHVFFYFFQILVKKAKRLNLKNNFYKLAANRKNDYKFL